MEGTNQRTDAIAGRVAAGRARKIKEYGFTGTEDATAIAKKAVEIGKVKAKLPENADRDLKSVVAGQEKYMTGLVADAAILYEDGKSKVPTSKGVKALIAAEKVRATLENGTEDEQADCILESVFGITEDAQAA